MIDMFDYNSNLEKTVFQIISESWDLDDEELTERVRFFLLEYITKWFFDNYNDLVKVKGNDIYFSKKFVLNYLYLAIPDKLESEWYELYVGTKRKNGEEMRFIYFKPTKEEV